jgi:hypothetical protein
MNEMPADETPADETPVEARHRGVPVFGIVLVLLGVVLLLQTLNVLPWRLWAEVLRYWPVILIAIGTHMLLSRRVPYLGAVLVALLLGGTVALAAVNVGSPDDGSVAGDRVEVTSFFGSANRSVTSQEFRGGEVVSAFGSVELDLRQGQLAEDGGTLTLTTVFGSVEMRLPNEWDLRIERTRHGAISPRPTFSLEGPGLSYRTIARPTRFPCDTPPVG